IVEINSGLLPYKELEKAKKHLLYLMVPNKEIQYMKSDRAEAEARELASSKYNDEKRVEVMKRLVTVHENFEYGIDGFIYLKGYNIPIPADLAESLLDAKYNPNSKYSVQSIVNFWQWAVMNPNQEARNDLFAWFKTGGFTITEAGN